MASNNSSGPEAARPDAPDNVTVRVITLAHGDRTENDLYLVLNFDTTVGELKQRIRDGLSRHPLPETQRLLYYGRPLLENSATLRQVLRQEQRTGGTTASHVLHLVIRDGQNDSTQRPATQPRVPGVTQTQVHITDPQHVQVQMPQLPQMPAGIPQLTHNMIHNSMHMMQHQMQHQRAVEEANRRARGIHNHIAPPSNEAHQNQTQIPTSQAPQTNERPSPPTQPLSGIQVIQNTQMMGIPMNNSPPQPATNPVLPTVQTTRIQETIGPNGERIRTVLNNNSMMFQMPGNSLPNPFDRPSSAPGASPSANSDPANRVNVPALPHIQLRGPPPMLPAGFPFPAGGHLPLPFPPAPQMNLPPLLNAGAAMASQVQPMAWLLSSPQGPQGIVFAPGHGYFSSNAPSVSLLSQVQNPNLQPTPTIPLPQTQTESQPREQSQQPGATSTAGPVNNNPPPPQPGARPQPNGQEVARAGAQAPAAGAAPAQQPANNENDILQLLINRGWLFLRLYMFVFIFSESGTWRRIIMLGSIIIFCLLPQQNPLTDMLDVMRRHFDRLIGPPQIPERQAPDAAAANNQQLVQRDQIQQNNNAPAPAAGAAAANTQDQNNPRPTPTTGRHMPTPEESARRLLAQHQDRRNAHPLLDMLYRIEQGVVLFLASLVPGVGERHVRAREEARRIVEADDRRLREETERQSQNSGENKATEASVEASGSSTTAASTTNASSSTAEASSSGVDPAAASNGQQGIRSRNAGGQQ